MTARRRLIVGSAGSTVAFGTIRSLRERYGDGVFVIAIDTNPRELVAASVLADAFVQVPPARSPQFMAALHGLAQSYASSAYLPLHDEEIEVTSRLAADEHLPAGLALVAPSHDVVRLCRDKWEMHRWLRVRGLPSAETELATPEGLARLQRPPLLKPRHGTGGANFPTIRLPSELAGIDPNQWLLQEVLRKPEVCVETFLARSRMVFRCVCREFIERKPGGPSTKVRIYDDPALTVIAERLARELPLPGAFCFEVMTDGTGDWQITDVNPRIGAGTRMCAALGVDIAAANLADFWGDETEPMLLPLGGEYYIVRQYEDYVTSRRDPTDRSS